MEKFPFAVLPGQASKLAQYQDMGVIGEGKYARVFKAKRLSDGKLVALKGLKVFEMESNERTSCVKEAELLRSVQHQNIIQCMDIFMENNELYMVLELANGGDLLQLIEEMRKKKALFAEIDIWRFVYFISLALVHMHSKRVMHRDIKPANVYITQSGEVKLGDLGLARIFSSVTDYAASVVGTPYYMSPELIQGSGYDQTADIWSFGCLIYEMAMLQLPFAVEKNNLYMLGTKIINCDYPPISHTYSDELKKLVSSMIVKDTKARLDALTVCELAKTQLDKLTKKTGEKGGSDAEAAKAKEAAGQSESKGEHKGERKVPASPSAGAAAAAVAAAVTGAGAGSGSGSSAAVPATAGGGSAMGAAFDAEFEDLGVIARGKYSAVHRARSRKTNRVVAVKKVQVFDMDSEGRKECLNEAQILQSLPDHPNIIKYIACFIHNNELYLILEMADSGDLSILLEAARKAKRPFSEADIWHYFAQISDALRAMHACRVMHRDIKPSNMFLSNNGRVVKLGDLGLGRYFSSKTYETFSLVGTPYYMSPEAIQSSGCDFKSDIWSLGCVLYEFAALVSPFYSPSMSPFLLGNKIKNCEYEPLPATSYSATLRNLVKAMIQLSPDDRPDINQVSQVAKSALEAFAKAASGEQKAPRPLGAAGAAAGAAAAAAAAAAGGGSKPGGAGSGSGSGASSKSAAMDLDDD